MNKRGEQDYKKPKKSSALWTVALLVCIILFLFSLIKIVEIYRDYKEAKDLYEATQGTYITPSDIYQSEPKAPVEVDFKGLTSVNEDVKAWIYMEDTVVNYPVLQGSNNNYYLDKTYDGNFVSSGSIFISYDNADDFSDNHTIVYGHNMRNNTMFGNLDDFWDEQYMEEHPYIYIMVPEGGWYKYEIYSAYRADIFDGTYEVGLNEKKKYEDFIKLTLDKNSYKGDGLAKPTADSKIITLSTCTEDSADYERFVIHGVLIETENLSEK